ncbi:hypothetical protein CRUP_029909 [Coryphaenoides rupestris]|nr:hypothetical protein CRUP_029909 [Coryphaenoides rupestris]
MPAELPLKPVERPQKPAEIPQKPAELPQKPAEIPQKPAELPLNPAERPRVFMDVFKNYDTQRDFMCYLKLVEGPCSDFKFYLMVEKLWHEQHGTPSQEDVDLRKRSSVKDLHKAQWLVFKDLENNWFTEYQETFRETDAHTDTVEAAGAPTEDEVKRQCTSSGFHSSMKLSGAQRDFEHYLARNLDDLSTKYVPAPNITSSRDVKMHRMVNGTRVVGNLLSNDLSFYVEANK